MKKSYTIQTRTAQQANEITKTLSGVLFSDEDDTMLEADLDAQEVEQLSKDNRVIYISEL